MSLCILPASEVAYTSIIAGKEAMTLKKGELPFASLSCFIPRNSVSGEVQVSQPFRAKANDLPFAFSLFGPVTDGRLLDKLKSAIAVPVIQKANGDVQYSFLERHIDAETIAKSIITNILSSAKSRPLTLSSLCFVIPDSYSTLKRKALIRLVRESALNEDIQIRLVNQSAAMAASVMKYCSGASNKLFLRIDTEGTTISVYSMSKVHATPVISVSDSTVIETDILSATLNACVKRLERNGFRALLQIVAKEARQKEFCRYLEVVRRHYATGEVAEIELDDGAEEEVLAEDCDEAVKSALPSLLNMIENCMLLSDVSMAKIDEIVLSGATMHHPLWREMLKKEYGKEVSVVSEDEICMSGNQIAASKSPAVAQGTQSAYSVSLGDDAVLCIPSGSSYPCQMPTKKCSFSYQSGVSSKDLLVIEQRFCDKQGVVVDRKPLKTIRVSDVYQLGVTMSIDANGLVLTQVEESAKNSDV